MARASHPHIPFNRPYLTGRELPYIRQAHANGHLSGDGPFTGRCSEWLVDKIGCAAAFLTPSGTAALEMAALLADLAPGDEVIMPSFTFVSTANAFVLRGAVPVFTDVREDTLNLDEGLIEAAITGRTRAVVPVHYGGVACEMDEISMVARKRGLTVIEDSAHGVMASCDGRTLGSMGAMAALSFHETKNIISGEGGALLVNDPELVERARIVRDKGTNRDAFFRGVVDKYTWVDVGSSFLANEISAAFLWAQMEMAEEMTHRRRALWAAYDAALGGSPLPDGVRLPIVPEGCVHNAHMYYLLLPGLRQRDAFISCLAREGIQAVFHYVPLHNSPAGSRFGRASGDLPVTDQVSERLVRLPLWLGLEVHIDRVIAEVLRALEVACT